MSETAPNSVTRFLQLIRFSHTIFALPFALGSLVVAADGMPPPRVLTLVLICMVAARTAAMLFNRWADWSLDQRNPRTVTRHRLLPKSTVALLVIVSSATFLAAAASINRLTLYLSPVALGIVFFYSITKRFTSATHFFLGAALGIAPVAAWIAQRGEIALPPVILGLAVVCWVAGFDLIYATQDYDFDRQEQLHSLVVKLGVERSLRFAQLLHFATLAGLIAFGIAAQLGSPYFAGMGVVAAALWLEHRTAQRRDVAGINRAFFLSNAVVSAVFITAIVADRLL
ncbi:MAG: UbiA-like polyprenyltransferase [Chthoniobacterales bacterium]